MEHSPRTGQHRALGPFEDKVALARYVALVLPTRDPEIAYLPLELEFPQDPPEAE